MRISQLRSFVAVSQLENMSKAAEFLHLSQSSLSKNISTLEDELGMQLFERNGRKLTLNVAGARLLEYSTMALRELEYAVEDMRLLSDKAGKRIRIGTAGYDDRLSECLAAFKKVSPEAEFELTGNIENQEHLDISKYDMLIYPDTHKFKKFTGMPLYKERYDLALPAHHELAQYPVMRAKMLEGLDIVFLRAGRSGEEYPYQIYSALDLHFASVCYADTRELHHNLIAEGLCAGFVPVNATSFYKENAIRLVPINDQRFSRNMMICFRHDKYLSPMARDFRDFVADYFELNTGS
ncbi:MAG: LysR family transcriptional regulator [Erysipelotrichaceae bacterium]|nr:LysR family transcriptional regulator [Erysipelotrichaceae bacterium]